VLIGTDRFHSVLVATREFSGVPEARWAEVAHPVQSLDRQQLHARAEEAVAQLVQILVGQEHQTDVQYSA
jgi:hypothetical protein